MARVLSLLVGIVVCIAAFSALADNSRNEAWKAAFQPLPKLAESEANPISPAKVALGKSLYTDKRLSLDNDLSCNSCHRLDTFGVDNQPTSPGHKGQRGDRNSPSSFNAALHVAQFWDGRAATVEAQALGPILNPKEMAMPSEAEVLKRLKADPKTVEAFKVAFPGQSDPVTYANVGNAIGAFERTLITPSRFDRFLNGDAKALTLTEKKGAQLFAETGCTACHNGATIGGLSFQKLGLVKPYPTKDAGRRNVTKQPVDAMVFKVPSLRNVDKTGPYFHDGSIKGLSEAVSTMAEYQLGKNLSPEQVADIVAFLKTLTAETPPKG
jgi:cytochrome c peroxidase